MMYITFTFYDKLPVVLFMYIQAAAFHFPLVRRERTVKAVAAISVITMVSLHVLA